jgi:DNA-binding response OmpR family regulator
MGKIRVLVADDEKLIADTLVLILNQAGFEARAVYACHQALEVAPSFEPDVLISDVLMGEWNGVDAAAEMRTGLPDLRVLLLTGQSASAEVLAKSKARELGFEVLVKPIHPRELMRKLHETAVDVRIVA